MKGDVGGKREREREERGCRGKTARERKYTEDQPRPPDKGKGRKNQTYYGNKN